jgi:hypothetical protein
MRRNLIYLLIAGILSGCSDNFTGELIFVEPDDSGTFNYPYYIYTPDNVATDKIIPIIIEPNNSGFADDDLQKHIEKAKRIATRDFYTGNYVARKLKIPLIVPVFPRTKTEWKIYTHALDRDVMTQKGNSLERIDLQLIEMFDDARSKLKEKNIHTEDKFLLTGFSASGTFVNRFTLIHPDNVLAVAAGGLNGLLMLPVDSLQGINLEYPIGTGDFDELLNSGFQKELFNQTPQLYFMGELDSNDAVPFEDAFSHIEREKIFSILGEEMHTERWQNCRKVYINKNVNATVKTFKNIGHEQPEIIKKEVVEFFIRESEM